MHAEGAKEKYVSLSKAPASVTEILVFFCGFCVHLILALFALKKIWPHDQPITTNLS